LPVRLGIAILKDRSGKIVLDVPIEGSLDNPQFKLRKVIWRAVGNIFAKAMLSPFSVLGAMFGGGKGDEIRYEDFTPGGAELTAASKEKLDVIVKSLYERPALQLEITGSVDTNADIDGLRERYLEKELRAQKWQTLRKADRTSTTPDQIVVTPEERSDLIKTLYTDALAKGLIVSSTNTPAGGKGPAIASQSGLKVASKEIQRGATALVHKENTPELVAVSTPAAPSQPATATTDPLEQALLQSISVSPGDFQSLATDRAKAARDYILQGGKVEGERVFLTEAKSAGLETEGPRVYLDLQ